MNGKTVVPAASEKVLDIIAPSDLAANPATTLRAPTRGRPLTRRLLRNRRILVGATVALLLIAIAALAPVISPFDPNAQNLDIRLQAPGTRDPAGDLHLLGTDHFGRDVLSRMIHGARTPLIVGFLAALLGAVLGLLIGLPAGYYGGRLDGILSMLTDITLSIPFVLLALAVIVIVGPSATTIILVFAFASWPINARVSRSAAISIRSSQFVEAAQSMGGGSLWILRRHVIRNAVAPTLVVTSVQVAHFIIFESAFSFLGLGVRPPDPTWGNMLADARAYLNIAWWMGTFPGIAIALAALAANLIGDGLRDVLDPRQARITRGVV